MKIDPYECNIGKYVTMGDVKKTLDQLIVETDGDMNYNYPDVNGIRPLIILGVNEQEDLVPVFRHPIMFVDNRGKQRVALDLRQFVKINKEEIVSVSQVVRDKAGFDVGVTRMIFMMLLADNSNNVMFIKNSLVTGFTTWLGGMISVALQLDTVEQMRLNIAITWYYTGIMKDGELNDSDMNRTMTNTYGIRQAKYIKDILVDLPKEITKDVDLIEIIKKSVNSPKTDTITLDFIYNIINNSYWGNNNHEMSILALEHVPTWIAIMHVVSTGRGYKKTKLASSLDRQKRRIKLDEFNKYVENKIKENTI